MDGVGAAGRDGPARASGRAGQVADDYDARAACAASVSSRSGRAASSTATTTKIGRSGVSSSPSNGATGVRSTRAYSSSAKVLVSATAATRAINLRSAAITIRYTRTAIASSCRPRISANGSSTTTTAASNAVA